MGKQGGTLWSITHFTKPPCFRFLQKYSFSNCVPQKRFEKHSKDGKILNSKIIEFMHQIILQKKFELICLHYSQMIIPLFFTTS